MTHDTFGDKGTRIVWCEPAGAGDPLFAEAKRERALVSKFKLHCAC